MDGDGLGDLEEADQLEPVQTLGAGLVLVDLGQPRIDGRIGGDEAVDVAEPEEPPEARASMVAGGAGALLLRLLVAGGVRPHPPDLERWMDGEEPAFRSSPIAAVLRDV